MTHSKERAKPTTDQITRVLRMLLEWAQGQGHVAAVAFPQDAMPKRRRKQQTAHEPEAPSEQPQAGN